MTLPRSAFKLGEDLARAHEQSAPGRITVIPVIVDDLDRVLPVLRALCEIAEGRLFDANDNGLQNSVPVTPDVVRRTGIETALTTTDAGPVRRVILDTLDAGQVDAKFQPATGADPSPGERAILAVARAVAHRDLDDRELAVIAYRESGIDYTFRRCLWNLAVDQLSDLPSTTLRTLVFVAEANIDIDLHCQSGRGFRFALNASRLLYRQQPDDLRVAAVTIATHPRHVVFFLGAGFSASSRLPLGNTLRDSAIRRLLSIPETEPASSEALGLRFHGWVTRHDGWLTDSELAMREDDFAKTLTLEQVIRIENKVAAGLQTLHAFRIHHDAVIDTPGSAVIDFSDVLRSMVGRAIVVEVNFDQLVERHSQVPVRVFVSDEDFADAAGYLQRYMAGRETAIPVLKIHGSIDLPDTCVVSDEQMQRGIGSGKLAALRAILSEPPILWLYVGASMRDRDLLPALRVEDFARGVDERWVSPYLDLSVELFARDRAALKRTPERTWIGDRLITETADAFFSALRRQFP